MNQMHTPTTTSTVGMFTTGDITPETVISDLFSELLIRVFIEIF